MIRSLLVVLFFVTPLLIYLPSLESVVLPKTVFMALMTSLLLAALILQPERLPREMDEIRTPLDAPLFGILGACALSVWLSGKPLYRATAYPQMLYGVVLVYVLIYLFRRHPPWIAYCRGALLASAALVSGYVVLQDYGVDFVPWAGGVPDWRGRLPGTMGNPNAVAGFLAVLLPTFVFQFFLEESPLRRALTGLGLTLVFLALVVTFSVGAWLGIVFGGVLAVWMMRKAQFKSLPWPVWSAVVIVLAGVFLLVEVSDRHSFLAAPLKWLHSPVVIVAALAALAAGAIGGARLAQKRFALKSRRIVIVGVLLLFAFLFYFTPNPWNGRPGSILDQARASDRWKTGGGARRFIWQTTALMVRDHPLSGIGFGQYFKVHAGYQGRLYALRGTPHDRPTVGRVPQVHNEYYQQMAETGLIGSVFFFWLVLGLVGLWAAAYNGTSGRKRGWTLAAILGVAILMIHALSSFPLRRPSTMLAGAFLLAQVVVAADPYVRRPGGGTSEAAGRVTPGVRAVILVLLAFQLTGFFRPLLAQVYLRRAVDVGRSSKEQWDNIRKAVAWNPNGYEPHSMAAGWLFQAGRYESAMASAQRALEAHEDLQARRIISDAYLAQGNRVLAARTWEDVLKLNPCYPPFLVEGARRYYEAGHSERAGELLDRALRLDPEVLGHAGGPAL